MSANYEGPAEEVILERSIAIVAPSSVPFQIGGAEKFWWGLYGGLSECTDHFVELIKIPTPEKSFWELIESYKTFSRLDLSHFDMVISSKYPAWMVQHPNHVLYLQHTLRGLYDTYKFTGLPTQIAQYPPALNELVQLIRKTEPDRDDLAQAFDMLDHLLKMKSVPSSFFTFPGPLIREVIHFFDRVALSPDQIKNYFAISGNVCRRPDYLPPAVKPIVLPHPSDIKNYLCEPGEYIFTASRLNSSKRVNLIVEAMAHVKTNVPLKIAGTGPDYEKLLALAESDNRIEFVGFVPDSDLPGYYAKSICVPFVPYDEDYGLITIEAMNSGKPVVTTLDAGGVCDFVEDGITGFCVPPTPDAIGAAIEKLASNPLLAQKMGNAAKKRVENISWKNIALTLTLENYKTGEAALTQQKETCLVCSLYPPSSTGSGIQRRLYHLCKALSADYRVIVISIGSRQVETRIQQGDCYLEISISGPMQTFRHDSRVTSETEPIADEPCRVKNDGLFGEFERLVGDFGKNARFALLTDPSLHASVKRILPLLATVYDAPGVEGDPNSLVAREPAQARRAQVLTNEEDCCRGASLIICRAREDMEGFGSAYSLDRTKMLLIPNGCDTSHISFRTRRERQGQRKKLACPKARLALFLGSASSHNLEACQYIFKFAERLPEVEFLIAGSVSKHPELAALQRPGNVHLLGQLSESVKTMLLECVDIGLNPVTSGAGTNLKVIEYVSAGLEAVSTPLGMKGFEGDFAGMVEICELERFPETIRQILNKPKKGNALRERAQKNLSNYTWLAATSPLSQAIKERLRIKENQ